MKNLLLSTLFTLVFLASYAQEFRILEQQLINDNSSFATLRYDRKDFGVAIINDKGVVKKEGALLSEPAGFGKIGNDFVVLTETVKKLKTVGYNVSFVNGKSLAVSEEKPIFTKTGSNKIARTIVNDPLGNLGYLLFRETNVSEGFQFFGSSALGTKFLESSTLSLITLNSKLESKTINLTTVASNSFFIDACSDVNKNIFICSSTSDVISVEKFDSNGKLLLKMTSPFSLSKNPYLSFVMKNDLGNPNCITIATSSANSNDKRVSNLFRFDFATGKVFKTGEVFLDKEYCKSLKTANKDVNCNSFNIGGGVNNFATIGLLEPNQILEDSNLIIVVKEIKTSVSSKDGATFYRNGSIISVYNKKTLEVERDIILSKSLASFMVIKDGLSVHLKNNKLWIAVCMNTGIAAFKTIVYKYDLATGEILEDKVDKEDDIGGGWATFPTNVGWYANNYVVPFMFAKAFIKLKFETAFVVKKY